MAVKQKQKQADTLVIYTMFFAFHQSSTQHITCTYSIEPVREKTNNLGSDQVRNKTACTITEDG